jgi:hypothetical protein
LRFELYRVTPHQCAVVAKKKEEEGAAANATEASEVLLSAVMSIVDLLAVPNRYQLSPDYLLNVQKNVK